MSINLVGPDGRDYHIESDDPAALSQAQALGYRPVSETAPKTLGESTQGALTEAGEVARAAGHGALSGLTAGLAATGDEAIEREKALNAEAHPIAHGVGEIVGMVASPVNLVAAPIEGARAATVLGRVGQKMLGGAGVGALFGAGRTVGESALGDADLTAEKLIAGAGLGALLGAAGGGVGAAVEEGARAVLPAARTLAARAQMALDDIANDAAISSTRAQQGVINRIGDDKLKRAAEVLRARGHLEMTPEAMTESIAKDREALGKTLGKFLDDADAAGSKADHMKMLSRLDDFEANLNPLEQDAIAGDLRAARKAVAKLGEEGSGFRALDDLKQTIQSKAKFSKGPTPLDDTTLGLKRGLAGTFRDELDQQLLPQLGADGAKVFTDSKAIYGALKDAERLAESGAGRVGERGSLAFVGLKDLVAGTILGGGSHAFGIAGALGSKVLREYGPAIVARVADKLAKEPALSAMAKSFAASLPETAPKLGSFGAVLAQEAAISPERALATHIAHAQLDPAYAATAQLAGLTPEQPDEAPFVLARAQTIAEAHAAAKAHDDDVRRGVERVFKSTGSQPSGDAFKSQDFGAMRMRRDAGGSFDKRVAEVRELAANPQALVDRVSANMAGLAQTAPGVSAAMVASASRAVQYLAQASVVPPKGGPLAPEWDAPEADRFAFAQKLEVVQDPMSTLKAAAAGTLTEDQVEALRAVYPKLAKQISDAALEQMAGAPSGVPYRARLMLEMLTGIDPDGTFSAEAIANNQAAIAASATRERSGTQGAPEGDADMSLAQRTATPNQRREVTDGP